VSAEANETYRYKKLKVRVWKFIAKFNGKKGFGLGDARAYLSAVTDILIVENDYKFTEALSEALDYMEKVYRAKGHSGVADDFKNVYKKWGELNRDKLVAEKVLDVGRLKEARRERDKGLTVISLFTGAFGLDLGFEYGGYTVTVALDISEDSYRNLKANRSKVPFLLGDVKNFSTSSILKEAGLRPGEADVVTGGPPCQPFSPAGKRRSLKDPRAAPLMDFIRVIREARPKAFVMEEVPGILSARIKHVPIKKRGQRPLSPGERPGSAWRVVIEELRKTGYNIAWKVLNAADFGTPQTRERVIIIGIRPDIGKPTFPSQTHTRTPITTLSGILEPWNTLAEALAKLDNKDGYTPLAPKFKKFMKYVPPGGNWRQIPDELKPNAMNEALIAGGGRMGFYRRLTWFEPSPTLVTSPSMKATMMIHPWEDRPLSVREYLRIQGFPDDWRVVFSPSKAYKLFGEAVPVQMAEAIARTLRGVLLGCGY